MPILQHSEPRQELLPCLWKLSQIAGLRVPLTLLSRDWCCRVSGALAEPLLITNLDLVSSQFFAPNVSHAIWANVLPNLFESLPVLFQVQDTVSTGPLG